MLNCEAPINHDQEIIRTRLIALGGKENSLPRHMVEVKDGKLIIPEQLLQELGIKNGDVMEMSIIGSTIFVQPSQFSSKMDDSIVEELIHEGVLIGM